MDQDKSDIVIIVSGLPRSGTSMMMKALEAGGVEALTDHIRKADEDNPKGYYEFERVKKTKEDPSWLPLANGKVVKMVYRLLYDLPQNYIYRVIFMIRDMQEILTSQKKMLQRSGKSQQPISDEQMAALFAAELDQCRRWLARQPNFTVLYVEYKDMIFQPEREACRIDDFLGAGLDVDAMAASVDPNLYRNRLADADP